MFDNHLVTQTVNIMPCLLYTHSIGYFITYDVHWKDWCWSWNSNTLATSCEELTHWKRPWCWEGLGTGGEGDNRRWDGWMASPTQWTWVWVNSRSWWWTGRPGVLWFMRLQIVGHDWVTELNWTELNWTYVLYFKQNVILMVIIYWGLLCQAPTEYSAYIISFKHWSKVVSF